MNLECWLCGKQEELPEQLIKKIILSSAPSVNNMEVVYEKWKDTGRVRYSGVLCPLCKKMKEEGFTDEMILNALNRKGGEEEMTVTIARLNEVETGFQPVPAGRYTLVINRSEVKIGKESGKQYLALEATVVGPTHHGRKMFWNMGLTPESASILKGLLIPTGVKINPNDSFDEKELMGRRVDSDISVVKNTYQGKTSDKNEVGPNYYPATTL